MDQLSGGCQTPYQGYAGKVYITEVGQTRYAFKMAYPPEGEDGSVSWEKGIPDDFYKKGAEKLFQVNCALSKHLDSLPIQRLVGYIHTPGVRKSDCIVSELVPGEPVSRKNAERIQANQWKGFLGVLATLDQQNWLHNDYKPDNLHLADDAVYLLDFDGALTVEQMKKREGYREVSTFPDFCPPNNLRYFEQQFLIPLLLFPSYSGNEPVEAVDKKLATSVMRPYISAKADYHRASAQRYKSAGNYAAEQYHTALATAYGLPNLPEEVMHLELLRAAADYTLGKTWIAVEWQGDQQQALERRWCAEQFLLRAGQKANTLLSSADDRLTKYAKAQLKWLEFMYNVIHQRTDSAQNLEAMYYTYSLPENAQISDVFSPPEPDLIRTLTLPKSVGVKLEYDAILKMV